MPRLVPRLAAVPSFLSILVLELQALDTMSAAADPFVCSTAKSPERKSKVLLTRSWFMPGASIATHCHVHAIYATRCEDECNCNPGQTSMFLTGLAKMVSRTPGGTGLEERDHIWTWESSQHCHPCQWVVGFTCGLGNPEVVAVPNLHPACHTVSL